MISRLRGAVIEKSLTHVVLDVGGVGYECGVSSTTSAEVPAPGSEQECVLYTYLQVRDDAIALYGFSTTEEREAFRKLVGVNGVGPKLALSVLSTFAPEALRAVVSAGDERRMATVPGVGKKMASRMVLELKDAFKEDLFTVGGSARASGAQPTPAGVSDATSALLSMGFTAAECELALTGYEGPDDAQEAIKYALRRIGGQG